MGRTGNWFYVLFTTILCLATIRSQEVFVVSDVYAIRPDGTVQELVTGEFGELKVRNGHWDAASRTIYLYAARNEEVAAQIVIPRTGESFAAELNGLQGPAVIPGDRVTFSTVAWVKHEDFGFLPDLVIPLDGSVNNIRSIDIPIDIPGIPKPGNTVGVLLMEVWTPRAAPAGVYHGTVRITNSNGIVAELNLSLTVFDFTLPDQPTFAFEFLSYGMPSRGFGMKTRINGDGLGKPARFMPESAKKINYQVYQLAFDNRCFVNVLPYRSQRGNPTHAYPVAGKGEQAHIMSFAEWDDFFAPILEGDLNKFRAPPGHFLLPFNINYPYVCESRPEKQFDFRPFKTGVPEGPGRDERLKEFEESYQAIAQQYLDHFAEKGWTKTIFQVFYNQKPNDKRNRTPWKLDEPTGLNDYRGLGYLFRLARVAFAGATEKGIHIANRLDIGHFNCDRFMTPKGVPTQCYKSKGYNRDKADRFLKGVVDHWVISTSHAAGAQHTLSEYHAPGVKMMTYSTAGTASPLAGHYGNFAGEGFIAARMGLQGRVIFKLGMRTSDPNHQKSSSYEGNVFYSGQGMGFQGALPSHRVKLWRNAVNDYDYLRLARQKAPEATRQILNHMVKIGPAKSSKYRKRSHSRDFWFNNNVEDILAARIRLAEIITGKCITDVKIHGFNERFTPCGAMERIVGYD